MMRRSMSDDFANIFRSFDNLLDSTLWDLDRAPFGATRRLLGGGTRDEQDRGWPTPRLGTGVPAGFPAMDCFTEDGHLVVRAEVPGVDPQDLDVSVEEGRLHVSGTKRHAREERGEDDRVLVSESYVGRFERVLPLPESVSTDGIQASHEDGVLEIRIPAERWLASRRRIPVRVEGREQKRLEGKRSMQDETRVA